MFPASNTPVKTRGPVGTMDGGTAFGCPRDFLDRRFVYTVLSPRARGLCVGVNMNPDKECNFDCVYCEVNRAEPARESRLDVGVMIEELERTLQQALSGRIGLRPCYRDVPPELLELRHVALSGDGEPTLSPNFAQAVEAVIHLRTRGRLPFFKIVLMTNASALDRPEVIQGLSCFAPNDEIWLKLESGTQTYADRIHRSSACTLEQIDANILGLARQRPVVLQSLFPSIDGAAPSAIEIETYVQRIAALKEAGAHVALVQIYSATRPATQSGCGHLPLGTLSAIARRVRETTGLNAEVF